jgi:hypothetical protein
VKKLALLDKHDILSASHDNLLNDHIMLNIAHKVIIASLNPCEPHSCTCVNLDNILLGANPCCSKERQSSIEHKSAGKLNRNKKAKQLRRRCLAQHAQDIHEHVVKKLEKGETTARVKLHKK